MRDPVSGSAPPLVRWSQTFPDHTDFPIEDCPKHSHVVFTHSNEINDRFTIWSGDITTLDVDAIVNTTDALLMENNAISDRILRAAGPKMKEELLTGNYECNLGEAVSTLGFDLKALHVIHTVCPQYNAKYSMDSDMLLQNCYFNSLRLAKELGARSIAIPVLNTKRRNFPTEGAAKIALRTIRKYIESNKTPYSVILCCDPIDVSLFNRLASNYFPRNSLEADLARWRLGEVESSNKESYYPERRIRIIHNPHSNADSAEDSDSALYDEDASAEAAAAFARACDTQHLLGRNPPRDLSLTTTVNDHERYDRLLRRAQIEDLSEVSGIGCLYQSGVDRLGRPVVIFIGKWFPIGDIDLEKALLYLIKLLDPIVRGDYVIAYFHTLASATNHPPFSWLKEVYTVLPYKYKKNLKAFYIVHPTFWTRMMTWWFTTFMAPAIKAKVHNLPGVEYLYSVMARDQLEVPAFVTEYDMTINGLHYFQPDTNET